MIRTMERGVRVDHLIVQVPEIVATHDWLLSMGYDQAWPVGPFWPWGLTSGVRIGSFNLELVETLGPAPADVPDVLQPLTLPVEEPRLALLVLAPSSAEGAREMLEGQGVATAVSEKVEADPRLLRMRGFLPEECGAPQPICTNVFPVGADLPFPFFFCDYAPRMRELLTPEETDLDFPDDVVELVLEVSDPERAGRCYRGMGGETPITFVAGEGPLGVRRLVRRDGLDLWAAIGS